jgi:hypothetical protein
MSQKEIGPDRPKVEAEGNKDKRKHPDTRCRGVEQWVLLR